MPKFTDLPEWESLSKPEKQVLKDTYDPKEYKNLLGDRSYSKKEAAISAKYQASIKKEDQ